ncbi:RNA 2',3'-cyclic phosphodiesterase [Marinobacter sp. AC-23]|uniref:RNA 2',3'-cyclic phosphodiesterase n=1 Tax=Marinobacter sp. AC-23 TaxID=1879031 RepID=UPI000A57D46A|nr:RNA 2',3'-cyclic phosphodiesterase [Marinobacter sp. AC-23]
MRRLFFGLEIPARIKARLLKTTAEMSAAKWQSVEQIHITLLFLGDVEEERLSAVCEAARNIPLAPFELSVTGLGCFGQPCAPRNLWAGVQPTAPVASLHSAIKGQMENLGLTTESRAFRPHITLPDSSASPVRFRACWPSMGKRLSGRFRWISSYSLRANKAPVVRYTR